MASCPRSADADDTVTSAVHAILAASRCVVFSGAGASADSGIGTFRGAGGAWSGITGTLALAWGGTPIGWRWTPGLVWSRFVKDFYGPIADAEPHDGLKALAQLQQQHFGASRMKFVTMNVDGLHQAAGSEEVAEVHGSVMKFRCMKCEAPATVMPPLDARRQPRCQQDDCSGRLRPDVTLFTESLPQEQWDAAYKAVRSLEQGDVMIVIGTSSVVYPAADLPAVAKRRRATLIEFNKDLPTPLSNLVDIAVCGRAVDMLRKVVDMVLHDKSARPMVL
eukprot:TRINITY_DN45978_c0_g1_i1.p1 TRINITY_DN45978_c0_g1~~TRINITY_DN45978_c0_g1_i1.p1  ORF type:complete len:278 (-),score=33.30 TRINITY_DN45978_c0_g1_i1:23-856(-)